LLLSALWAGDIDRQLVRGAGAAYQLQARCSAAMAPQLGAQQQTHVDRASHYSAAQRILS